MSTPLAVFGPGILILTRTDVAIGSPINVGYVQEFSIEAAGQTKMLYGQKQWPLVAARGTIKGTAKFKAAVISGLAWNTAFYGESAFSTTAGLTWNIDSTFSVSTSSTQIAASTATWEADLGVKYAASGLPLIRVASGSEATGKYSVSGGIYVFATGDSGVAMKLTYTTTRSGSGQVLRVSNQNIGQTPTFQIDYYTSLNQPTAKPFIVRCYQAIGGKHTMGFKLEDFMIPEFDMDLFANASDQVYNLDFPEIS